MISLSILQARSGVSIQDGGRRGYLRYGVTGAGPMDPIAFATANLAVGNPRQAAAIEVPLSGLEVEACGGPLDVAVAGGQFDVQLDGRSLGRAVALRLQPEHRLTLRAGDAGSWAYLAIAGCFDLPPVLGSLSTHTRSRLGGLEGRGLQAGDSLAITQARSCLDGPCQIEAPWLEPEPKPIRVVLGPQDDYFSEADIEAFLTQEWRISLQSDRMAYALEGKPLRHINGHDIVSDGVAHGAIQVPGSGQPFVLMADRQPTGGYPKIATVIGVDLGRFAQLRAGSSVRFQAVSIEEAVAARRQIEKLLAGGIELEPLIQHEFSSEFLLSCNLIDGFVSAVDSSVSFLL